MSALPRVTALTRERVARKFDHSVPDACIAEITANLEQENPELLDMILKCASDLGNRSKVTLGLGMFYRLMVAQSWGGHRQIAAESAAARHTGNAKSDREADRPGGRRGLHKAMHRGSGAKQPGTPADGT